jgi:hypothetical protein
MKTPVKQKLLPTPGDLFLVKESFPFDGHNTELRHLPTKQCFRNEVIVFVCNVDIASWKMSAMFMSKSGVTVIYNKYEIPRFLKFLRHAKGT